MKAKLDGIPVSIMNESLKFPDLTLRAEDESGEIAFSFAGDLEFEGPEYTYLYQLLKTDPLALVNEVTLTLENDCCKVPQIYEFTITHEGLEWCQDSCKIKAVAIEKSIARQQLTCLKNTLIWDNYAGFQSKQHPRFSYCNELRPNWMHDVLIILAVATATSILVFIPLIATVVTAFNVINNILSWMNSNLNTSFSLLTIGGQTQLSLNDLQNYFNLLISFIVGCGRKHPSPLVRDYADNVCGKCGLKFVSSIYNNGLSDYYNTCYVNAPIDKGTLETDATTFWIDANKPLRNGIQYFNEIKAPVNGKWKILNNQLILERRDFFKPTVPWLDLTKDVNGNWNDPRVISVCWKWARNPRYAYANFEYQRDAVNWVGAEAGQRWNDIVEWNSPYSPLQKDEFKPLIPFSACRFRDDGIDRDVLSTYRNFPTIGPMIKKYDDALIMNSHTCYTPMLLIWDTGSAIDNAKVQRGYFPTGVASNQAFNYPWWFDQQYPNNLYDRFWAIDNPKLTSSLPLDFEAEVKFDCALLDAIDLEGIIQTIEGDGKAIQINVNFNENKLIIAGQV